MKVEPTKKTGIWLVRDQKGDIRQFVRPQDLPERVREAVQTARRAYFHVMPTSGSVAFGPRVVGDPNWK